jgi:DNA repair protein SbcC/Rad50
LRVVVEELTRVAGLVQETCLVAEAAERAEARAQDLRERTHAAAAAHGFCSVDDARAALLSPDDQARLRELIDERERTAARAEAILGDTGPAPRDQASPGDVASLSGELEETEVAQAETARTLHLAEERVESLRSLAVRLDTAITAWAPARDDSLRAEAMSRLVRGMGHENHLQMRLSAYVLATRLDQVVGAANERLGLMRDQRYLLQRTDRAYRKGSQAGLGLEIVDQWTGDARDPATLSGGETFVVSLSLALGLADVVTQESGGTEIETLFVDEGFGTLDADTLDDVMDRLDGLRAGGRTVGVVSHVSELRNRIPTQVHVEKGRSGSSVTVTTLVG